METLHRPTAPGQATAAAVREGRPSAVDRHPAESGEVAAAGLRPVWQKPTGVVIGAALKQAGGRRRSLLGGAESACVEGQCVGGRRRAQAGSGTVRGQADIGGRRRSSAGRRRSRTSGRQRAVPRVDR